MAILVVKDTFVSYERPSYPVIRVVAEDKMAIWEIAQVTATEFYENDPKTVLEDIMYTHANVPMGDQAWPIFDTADTIYYQWLEEEIKATIEQVCHRFGYYPRIRYDGKITARKISNLNPVDHSYSGKSWLVSFTPDDSFSDYTNRVIVIGEGRDFLEVLYDEESITSLSGTCGWWGSKKTKVVPYSEDGSRTCRYPRMEVIESVKNFNFKLGGGGESIIYVDPNEHYIIIEIDTPNLVWVLIGLLAALVAEAIICVSCDVTWTCGICQLIMSITLAVLIGIVASNANYHYAIHAQPIGKIRQSFQGQADDTVLQALIQAVVKKEFQDPLCYTQAQCQAVANFELLIAQLQRNRIRFTKTAHLQDEDGDTISFQHPYSGLTYSMFITDLTRRFKVPANSGKDGYFLDDLEGWRL
jgi:hypothetical protein